MEPTFRLPNAFCDSLGRVINAGRKTNHPTRSRSTTQDMDKIVGDVLGWLESTVLAPARTATGLDKSAGEPAPTNLGDRPSDERGAGDSAVRPELQHAVQQVGDQTDEALRKIREMRAQCSTLTKERLRAASNISELMQEREKLSKQSLHPSKTRQVEMQQGVLKKKIIAAHDAYSNADYNVQKRRASLVALQEANLQNLTTGAAVFRRPSRAPSNESTHSQSPTRVSSRAASSESTGKPSPRCSRSRSPQRVKFGKDTNFARRSESPSAIRRG